MCSCYSGNRRRSGVTQPESCICRQDGDSLRPCLDTPVKLKRRSAKGGLAAISFHESLELGGEKPYGRFISSPISGVESKDISAAMRAVLDREGKELWGFFATWEPWQAVLRDKYPNEVDEIENAIADGNYWKNIEREVQNDLENRAVPSALRPAALTQELKQRGQDKQRELWLALTMKAWKDQDA